MSESYRVEFSGLTEEQAHKVLEVVRQRVGRFGHRLLPDDTFTIAGATPVQPAAGTAPKITRTRGK